ncbi:MAG: hypothetical protein EP321_11340 [Sphingomonadales bacterium]|nr:MAG: hypothetical protein EP345_01705 [Sphingomonadales bacterium]TNF03167.1 MAG: hypothetical protein EP321_11340 [Sphingomonadales bacterium]
MKFDWLIAISSPLDIFLDADPVVQAIIILLLLASVASWAIMIDRGWTVAAERRRSREAQHNLLAVGTLDELHHLGEMSGACVGKVLGAVEGEWRWSSRNAKQDYGEIRPRLLSVAEIAIAREGRLLAGRTALLATIGSSAPFVGLFGTVWGIMRSFMAIGQAQDTSLAIVAPGIAEALLATAAGLFCAIPAVIGYNRLLRRLGEVDLEWRTIAGLLEVAISRQFSGRN